MTFVLTGLDIEEKAKLAEETLFQKLGGRDRFDEVNVQLIRSDDADPETNEQASAFLRVTVKDRDPKKVGRSFSNAVVEMALAGELPGLLHDFAANTGGLLRRVLARAGEGNRNPPGGGGAGWPRTRRSSGPYPACDVSTRHAARAPTANPRRRNPRLPLGTLVGARSGDKGGNVGLWTRNDEVYAWLASYMAVERFKALVTEARDLEVQRYELPNLRALNFVIVGLLGEGVASSTRQDPQAKSLGEYVRAKVVDIPAALLA